MALSCCASFNPYQHFSQETTNFSQPDWPSDLFSFFDDYENVNSLLDDAFWEHDDQLQAQPTSQSLPDFASSESVLPISAEKYISDEFYCFNFPKRLKTEDHGLCSSDCTFNPEGLPILSPEMLPELSYSLPGLQQPMSFHMGEFHSTQKSNECRLSPQSVAARQRRKKISDKTQQLGKLIPGGNQMNTAEMLMAASKYVKFMQAQIGILQLMGGPIKEMKEKEPLSVEGLHPLLSSSKIQEKLSGNQKCLVPKGLVERLTKDEKLQSSPSVAQQLHCLLE